MIPRYHLELICEDADRLVYEESANYGDAFTCLCIGIILLAIAIIGIRLGAEDLTRRKFLSTSFVSGFGFCCLSIPYLIKSRITLDRQLQTLAIHRRLAGITWNIQYRLGEIEQFLETVPGREVRKRTLDLELTSGRAKKLTLWGGKRESVSKDAAHLNESLKQFRSYGARQAHRLYRPLTDAEKWEHTKKNAAADLRRHIRRALYVLIAFVSVTATVVPFLHGNPLNRYWTNIGGAVLLVSVCLWIALILETVFTYIDWRYVRDLDKIEKEWGKPDD
jgi:hypothetical protein